MCNERDIRYVRSASKQQLIELLLADQEEEDCLNDQQIVDPVEWLNGDLSDEEEEEEEEEEDEEHEIENDY